jgi:hypothetical protein
LIFLLPLLGEGPTHCVRTQALDPFKVSFGIGLLHWIEDYTIISDLLVVWLAIVQPSLAVFPRCSAKWQNRKLLVS